jgi:predicted DNA-binding transcriptional regulator AlpA
MKHELHSSPSNTNKRPGPGKPGAKAIPRGQPTASNPSALPASSGGPLKRPREAAEHLNISLRTLCRLTPELGGPPRVRLTNNRVAYRVQDLDAWIAARLEAGLPGRSPAASTSEGV